jgi:hypothetical protein
LAFASIVSLSIPSTGTYLVWASTWANDLGTNSSVSIRLRRNGTTTLTDSLKTGGDGGATVLDSFVLSTIGRQAFTSGDTVELEAARTGTSGDLNNTQLMFLKVS